MVKKLGVGTIGQLVLCWQGRLAGIAITIDQVDRAHSQFVNQSLGLVRCAVDTLDEKAFGCRVAGTLKSMAFKGPTLGMSRKRKASILASARAWLFIIGTPLPLVLGAGKAVKELLL
jgi:hypothetical protein